MEPYGVRVREISVALSAEQETHRRHFNALCFNALLLATYLLQWFARWFLIITGKSLFPKSRAFKSGSLA